MLPLKLTCILPVLMVVAGSYAAPTENVHPHEPPIVSPNFYDPNHHDDGRSRLFRGPSAASSSSTLSIMNPYANSATRNEHYSPPPPQSPSSSSGGGGGIMAIVDHYYGPDGEEKVQYKSASDMDKEELDQILASLGSAKLSSQQPPLPPHMAPPSTSAKHHYGPPPPPLSKLPPPPPPKYGNGPPSPKYGGGPPASSVSNIYKPHSSPSSSSYASTTNGFSLPSLYKSSSEAYSKPSPPASPYRPAFSTIYKDTPQSYASISSSAGKSPYHQSKGPSDYLPPKEPHYASSYKEPVPHHPHKELSYMRGPPYYMHDSYPPPNAPGSPPKPASDSNLHSDGYKSFAPPPKGFASVNVIDHDEGSVPYYPPSSSYPPPPPRYSSPPSSYPPPPSNYSPPPSSYPPPPSNYLPPPSNYSPPPSPPSAIRNHHPHSPHPPPGHSPSVTQIHSVRDEYPMTDGKLYSPSVHLLKDEYSSFGKEPSPPKPDHSLKYSTPDINYAPPPSHTVHPNAYTSGFSSVYADETGPFTRLGPNKEYSKRPPPPYSSSPSMGGHSLSSLYAPLSFEELYNSPKSQYASPPKSVFSGSSSGSKPSYGPPSPSYGHSYGSPVEYHMPPKGPYSSSSSPYGSPHGGSISSPKYKGPYRTVNTDPYGYASYAYGYGRPQQHQQLHVRTEDEHDSPRYPHPYRYPRPPIRVESISMTKDEYERLENDHKYSGDHKYNGGHKYSDDHKYNSEHKYNDDHKYNSEHKYNDDHKYSDNRKYKEEKSILSTSSSSPTGSSSAPPEPKKEVIPYEKDRTQIQQLYRRPQPPPEPTRHPSSNKVPMEKPQYSRLIHTDIHGNQMSSPSSYSQHVSAPDSSQSQPQKLRGEQSDEVVNIHVYERGFFDKTRKQKVTQASSEWKPIINPGYNLGPTITLTASQEARGGHGSASMEIEHVVAAANLELNRNKFLDRPPPPSHRNSANVGPYRGKGENDENDSHMQNVPYIHYDGRRI